MKLDTPRKVIAELGGIKTVAEITGRTYQAVENWNRKKTFPANTYVILLRALAKRACTAPDSLWGM